MNYTSSSRFSSHFLTAELLIAVFSVFLSSCRNPDLDAQSNSNASIQPASYTEDIRKESPWSLSLTEARRRARAVIDTLTLREKIGQLFFIEANGTYLHEEDESYLKLIHKIRSQHVGGILFFDGSIYAQAHLTNRLQRASALPLWITQDMEFGAAMRIHGTTTLTPAMGISATGDPFHAWQAGFITAKEARALGVHQIFAPVVDINNNPRNPVINVRSFGGTAEIVTRYSIPFIKGVQQTGVLSTAKHFPGHGDTHLDSHLHLPVIRSNYRQIRNQELIPFHSAIEAGVKSVMSAHISYPKISNQKRLPATMDPYILNRILRDSLQFDGLVVTDALEMRGITNYYSPGEAALKSIQAGSDILLISPDATAAIHHIVSAVQRGKLSEKRINRSVRKLLTWKFRKGLFEDRTVDLDQLPNTVDAPKHRAVANQIARESITLLHNRLNIVPIHAGEYASICAVALADDRSGETGSRLGDQLRRYHPNVTFYTFDRRSGAEEKRQIRRCARRADLLVIGSFIYVSTYEDINLNLEQRQFIESLSAYGNPEVLISFGNPYIFEDIPHAEVDLQAWAPFSIQVDAAVGALFGASEIAGNMPIRFPTHFERGDGLFLPQSAPAPASGRTPAISGVLSQSLRRQFDAAIGDSLFPGAVLSIMEEGRVLYNQAFGYQSFKKEERLKLDQPVPLPGLDREMAAFPLLLQGLKENNVKFKAELSSLPEEKSASTKIAKLHDLIRSDRSEKSVPSLWTRIPQLLELSERTDIERHIHKTLWRPLEMRNTFLQFNKNDKKDPAPLLHSTTGDLAKLLFTMMNKGQYKDKTLFEKSVDFPEGYRKAKQEKLSVEYTRLGNESSRIWLSPDTKRSIMLLIPTEREQSLTDDRLQRFRRTLLRRVDQFLHNPPAGPLYSRPQSDQASMNL